MCRLNRCDLCPRLCVVVFKQASACVTAAGKGWREGPGKTNGVPIPAAGERHCVEKPNPNLTWDAVHAGAAILDTGAAGAVDGYLLTGTLYLSIRMQALSTSLSKLNKRTHPLYPVLRVAYLFEKQHGRQAGAEDVGALQVRRWQRQI